MEGSAILRGTGGQRGWLNDPDGGNVVGSIQRRLLQRRIPRGENELGMEFDAQLGFMDRYMASILAQYGLESARRVLRFGRRSIVYVIRIDEAGARGQTGAGSQTAKSSTEGKLSRFTGSEGLRGQRRVPGRNEKDNGAPAGPWYSHLERVIAEKMPTKVSALQASDVGESC